MPTISRLLPTALAAALLLVSTGARAQDLDQLQRAIDANPEDGGAYERYATEAIRNKQYDEAIARLRLGVARIPEFARAYYLLGVAARNRAGTATAQKSDWNDAAVYYRVYIALRPSETDAWFGLGKALAGMNESRAAVVAFRQYIAQEKREDRQRFVEVARTEVSRLEGGGVATPVAPVAPVAKTGGGAAALKAEADKLKNEGKFEEAVTVYRRALEVDPNDPNVHNDLGNAYYGLKRYVEAAGSFKDAVARDPNYAIGWYNLANASRKADRKADAVDAYKHYMQLQPNDADPWFGMAQTLKAMGDNPAATAAFKKYLEMEKRPEQEKWIAKARAELASMEPATPPPPTTSPGGKVGFEGM